jgi:hypothetical protein
MPSIFIWKAESVNTSKSTIRIYTGSNWTLEDNNNISVSYKYNEQIVIPGFGDSVITFNARKMPYDWIGSNLLEVSVLPYSCIKTDNYGTLEHIGSWMRCTLTKDILAAELENEIKYIEKWIKISVNYHKPVPIPSSHEINTSFDSFFNKYNINNIPELNILIHKGHKMQQNYKKRIINRC